MANFLVPLGILFEMYERDGWAGVFLLSLFSLLFIVSSIFMGIDIAHGVSGPLDPRSVFMTWIPWTKLFILSGLIAMVALVKYTHTKTRAKAA